MHCNSRLHLIVVWHPRLCVEVLVYLQNLHQSLLNCACHLLAYSSARGHFVGLYALHGSASGLLPMAMCMIWHESWHFRIWLAHLCCLLLYVTQAASVWRMSGWCMILVAFAEQLCHRGCRGFIPATPCEASQSINQLCLEAV